MKILVLGAGLQGSACAFDLLRQADVERVTLADLEPEKAGAFLPEDGRLRRERLDFTDEAALREAIAAHQVVLSAAPFYFNDDLARLAIEGARPFADLGGNTEVLRRQMAMDGRARAAGVAVVPDVGLAPGLVNVLAAEGIRRLDEPRRIRMFVGGLPQNPRPPLNYQLVYSLEGTLDYYTTPSWVLREGRLAEVEALSEVETLDFEGLGPLEAFHTAGGASLLPWAFEGEVDRLEYKTLRYPGHAEIMRAVRELGLLSRAPVAIEGHEVAPRDVFIACVTPRLTFPDEPDLVVLRVVAEGTREGRRMRLTWNLIDRADPETKVSAMERTTGFSLAITGLLLGRGAIERPGVRPAYEALPYEAYLDALAEREIRVRFRERERDAERPAEGAPDAGTNTPDAGPRASNAGPGAPDAGPGAPNAAARGGV